MDYPLEGFGGAAPGAILGRFEDWAHVFFAEFVLGSEDCGVGNYLMNEILEREFHFFADISCVYHLEIEPRLVGPLPLRLVTVGGGFERKLVGLNLAKWGTWLLEICSTRRRFPESNSEVKRSRSNSWEVWDG